MPVSYGKMGHGVYMLSSIKKKQERRDGYNMPLPDRLKNGDALFTPNRKDAFIVRRTTKKDEYGEPMYNIARVHPDGGYRFTRTLWTRDKLDSILEM